MFNWKLGTNAPVCSEFTVVSQVHQGPKNRNSWMQRE